jgi:hypothetical protein
MKDGLKLMSFDIVLGCWFIGKKKACENLVLLAYSSLKFGLAHLNTSNSNRLATTCMSKL